MTLPHNENLVYCPICNKSMTWEEYREHAKKEFGKMESFTKCCNVGHWFFDSNGKLRCDSCGKFTKLYEKFMEYIVPERREQ